MKRKSFNFYIVMFITSFVYSCDDMLSISPKGEPSEAQLANKVGIEGLLIGVYSAINGDTGQMGGAGAWSNSVDNWVFGGVTSDDAYKGSVSGDQVQINELEGFFVAPNNLYVNFHWEQNYAGIHRANNVLRILELVDDMTDAEKVNVEAQLRFIRGHFYVELVRVHGNVPWIDGSNMEIAGTVPNNREIWDEILADFQFAAENLPNRQSDPGRPTEWAAKTYMAYIYMYRSMYEDAKPLLEDVYANGGFSLMPEYLQNYLIAYNNNEESIFEIQASVNDGSPGGRWGDGPNAITGSSLIGMTFMGGSGFYQPTHNLVSHYRVDNNGLPEFLGESYSADHYIPYDASGQTVAYEGPVDPRLDHTIGRPGIPFLDWGIQKGHEWIRDPTNGGPYITKKQMFLQSETGSGSQSAGRTFPNANNYRKFKLGMVILWLAECEVEIGSLDRATELVNLIRNRAKQSTVVSFDDGSPAANYEVEPYPGIFPSQEYGRHAVRHELRMELSMEGYRFYDLVRWGIAEETMNQYFAVESNYLGYLKGLNFTAGQNEIFPIPQLQIDLSLNENGQSVLIQNPGY